MMERYYVVNSGTGRRVSQGSTHIMRSRSSRTPVTGALMELTLGGAGAHKRTLCGRPALRDVSGVFTPEQASCRECKVRYAKLVPAAAPSPPRLAVGERLNRQPKPTPPARPQGTEPELAMQFAKIQADLDRKLSNPTPADTREVYEQELNAAEAWVRSAEGRAWVGSRKGKAAIATYAGDDMPFSIKAQLSHFVGPRRASLGGPQVWPPVHATNEEESMNDHVNSGHCDCPTCSRDRLALAAQRRAEREGSHTYYDRAVQPPSVRDNTVEPAPVAPSGHPPVEKRTTRADRDAVVDVLSQHFAAGSLDSEVFAERQDTAMRAVWPRQLASLTTDLPDLPAPAPEPVPESAKRSRLGGLLVLIRIALGITLFCLILASANAGLIVIGVLYALIEIARYESVRRQKHGEAKLWAISSRPSSPSSSGPWRCSDTPARQRRPLPTT
jgi:hypothetical protein